MNDLVKHTGGALALQEGQLIEVLQSSLYPGADPNSIRMVIGYCKAAGLDPMQKPVHIVPMWDSKLGKMRDVIMPGVGLYRTNASRTGEFAGMSEPEFGPMVDGELGGQKIQYPEWCRVVVKRALKSGLTAEFTAVEYWVENYAQKGGKEKSVAPNAMWSRRPRGQLAKCASAQALRIAFPELGASPTAEEVEGKPIIDDEAPPRQEITTAPSLTQEQLNQWKAACEKGTGSAREFWKKVGAEFRKSATAQQQNSMWAIAEAFDREREGGGPVAAKPAETQATSPTGKTDQATGEIHEATPATVSGENADFIAALDAADAVKP